MNYTVEQEEIIKGLNDRKFSNIWEYLIWITPTPNKKHKKVQSNDSDFYWHICIFKDNHAITGFDYLRLTSKTKGKLIEFLTICTELRDNKLISTMIPNGHFNVNPGSDFPNFNLSDEEKVMITNIVELLHNNLPTEPATETGYIKKENYHPLPALQEFINNNYTTKDDLKYKEQLLLQEKQTNEKKLSSKSNKKTNFIYFIIPVLLAIGFFVWENFCSKKESALIANKKDTIKNPQDTIKVINITQIKPILKDTVKADTIKK